MKTLMRNGRDRQSENPSLGHAKQERVSLFGTDQRITSGPVARRPHSKERRFMGGLGSGPRSGRATVESALRLDIDAMMRRGLVRPGARVGCELRFSLDDDEIDIRCEAHAGAPGGGFVRLRYAMADYWTGEEIEIDDKIFLTTTRPPFGGLRWWFQCPRSGRRVRKLYLPLGGRHFWSRRAYGLAYVSQRETVHDRAMRRARKLYLRLGGDPDDDEYPDKPKRMRWTTYNRLIDKLIAADGVADGRLVLLAARLLGP
jgi:hypothetical protein